MVQVGGETLLGSSESQRVSGVKTKILDNGECSPQCTSDGYTTQNNICRKA